LQNMHPKFSQAQPITAGGGGGSSGSWRGNGWSMSERMFMSQPFKPRGERNRTAVPAAGSRRDAARAAERRAESAARKKGVGYFYPIAAKSLVNELYDAFDWAEVAGTRAEVNYENFRLEKIGPSAIAGCTTVGSVFKHHGALQAQLIGACTTPAVSAVASFATAAASSPAVGQQVSRSGGGTYRTVWRGLVSARRDWGDADLGFYPKPLVRYQPAQELWKRRFQGESGCRECGLRGDGYSY